MRTSHLLAATVLSLASTIGFAPGAQAQAKMDRIMEMDTDRDGMVSKAEFLRKMEAMFDQMDKGKKGRLTAKDVAAIIKHTAEFYGTSSL